MNNQKITTEMIDSYLNTINVENTRTMVDEELKKLDLQKKEFTDSMNCDDDTKDILLDKIATMDSKYLEKSLKSDKFVESLFTDEDGDPIDFDVDFKGDKKSEIEFKRGFASWWNSCTVMEQQLHDQMEAYKKDIANTQIELDEAVYNLSDNILNYTQYLKDQAYETKDQKEIDRVVTLTKYMESAYTMDVYRENLEKYPSVIQNTLKDLNKESRVESIGKRYMDKLKSQKLHAHLIKFASSEKQKSFEELHLPNGTYEYPDLFVFSLIRFFSMADWSDVNIRRMHATTYIVLDNIYNDNMDFGVRKNVKDSIIEYLALFNQKK